MLRSTARVRRLRWPRSLAISPTSRIVPSSDLDPGGPRAISARSPRDLWPKISEGNPCAISPVVDSRRWGLLIQPERTFVERVFDRRWPDTEHLFCGQPVDEVVGKAVDYPTTRGDPGQVFHRLGKLPGFCYPQFGLPARDLVISGALRPIPRLRVAFMFHTIAHSRQEVKPESRKLSLDFALSICYTAGMTTTPDVPEAAQLALDDLVHDSFSRKASNLNNAGPWDQVLYLVGEHLLTEDEGKDFLDILGIPH